MTAVSLAAVATIVHANGGDLSKALPLILFVFFAAGTIQVLLGVFKLGTLIKFIPATVVSGFMSGIGFIILITQIPNLLGFKAGGVLSSIQAIPHALANINVIEFVLAILTIGVIYGFKKITKAVPSTLLY
jgi:SulP family sulfate permease